MVLLPGFVLTTWYFIYASNLACVCMCVYKCVCARGYVSSSLNASSSLHCKEEAQAGLRSLRLTEWAFIFTPEQTPQPCWGFASQSSTSLCSEIKTVTGYRYHLFCSLTEHLQPIAQLCLQSAGKKKKKRATNLFNWQDLHSKLLLGQVFCGISIFDSTGFTQMKRDTCTLKKCPEE